MAAFVLHVQDIDASGKDYRFELDEGWLRRALEGSSLSAARSGSLEVHAQRSGADVLVQGRIRTPAVAQCVRCLGDAPIDVDTTIATLFTARGAQFRAEPDEVELTPEDLEREFFRGNEIVLDPIVREHIILECPMQPLCREDCEGIEVPSDVRGSEEPSDSEGRPVDPRLAPLLRLAREMKDEE